MAIWDALFGIVPSMLINPQPTVQGNIDLQNRPTVQNPDGSVSTVRSMSVNLGGKEVLIPTVSQEGKIMNPEEAIQYFQKTGQHLGMFNTPQEATTAAENIHTQQEASTLLSNLMQKSKPLQYDAVKQQLTDAVRIAKKPSAGLWGTQTNYFDKVLENPEKIIGRISMLSAKNIDILKFAAEEAPKYGVDPGFIVAQILHETSNFKNTLGNNLFGRKIQKNDPFVLARTFEKVTPNEAIAEFKRGPWRIFKTGTGDNKINQTEEDTKIFNDTLKEARATNNWSNLKSLLDSYPKDKQGKISISIVDKFKKFESQKESVTDALKLWQKKLKDN